ncbi:hypothetical protein ACH49_10150 [Streptomyces leeuwenhoekii]|uniref:Uncharacterized protein n=1 Tax=Streptomyces leeuwenhoekii TaxID=1437453 RepID=A0ABR5I0J9_STRLW|nr:hypothetical protein [Streptomyces leeuwenhoekii]KMS79900.1 hypothetical protein ACH49_10150 [Streptomyces leeuwenhoekii]
MTPPDRMSPAPVLGLLPAEPDPVAGCATCQDLARKREAARAARDGSRVSDCNVLIRAHPHASPRSLGWRS